MIPCEHCIHRDVCLYKETFLKGSKAVYDAVKEFVIMPMFGASFFCNSYVSEPTNARKRNKYD